MAKRYVAIFVNARESSFFYVKAQLSFEVSLNRDAFLSFLGESDRVKKKSPPVKIAQDIEEGYGAPSIPIFSYAALIGTYATAFGGLYWLSTRNGRELRQPRGFDLGLLVIASYKLSRVVTMSYIASPVRAPFTHRGHSLAAGEVQDVARGKGLQNAIGHLVTCPFCFGVWSSTALLFAYNFAPRATRQASYILSMAAADDILHLGFKRVRSAVEAVG